ncbi:MAG: carbon storage regulator CsrA [Candidatus Binatia bacterium]
MLVLTRKIGELVRIGDQITVRVLAVRNRQVSLGFVAPSDVKIYREEVLRLIESENRRAQLGSPDHLSAIAALWEEQGRGRHR